MMSARHQSSFYQIVAVCLASAMLLACSQEKPAAEKPATVTHSHAADVSAADGSSLVGCYSIDAANGIAQIKIAQSGDKLTMQMKEPKGATTPWDQPEALNTPSVKDGWEQFSTNAINLTRNDVSAIVVRPDKVMAIAALNPASANTNPMLDSAYAVSLMGTVNTIYQVPCDDKPLDLVK